MKEILGDYEPRGRTVQAVGKFLAFVLDDPFHITTIAGLTLYGIGKYLEKKKTNYGLRIAYQELEEFKRRLRDAILDINSLRI